MYQYWRHILVTGFYLIRMCPFLLVCHWLLAEAEGLVAGVAGLRQLRPLRRRLPRRPLRQLHVSFTLLCYL